MASLFNNHLKRKYVPELFLNNTFKNAIKVAVSVGSAQEGAMLLWLYFEM